LEHRTQKIASLARFLLRLGRYGLFAVMLIVFSLGIGTSGYHHFAQLNWLDSFHMSSMILTGMGPVSNMATEGAKLFSSFYAIYSSFALLSISAVFFAPIIHRLLHLLQFEENNNDQ
jgi:hypothetical protein